MSNTNVFETANRKLEQFLYMHNIRHIRFRKNEDGMTVWEYPNTPNVKKVVEEFRMIAAQRQMEGN